MKLEWRQSSDGERWYANVEGGQLITSKGITHWRIDTFALPESMRHDSLALHVALYRFDDPHKAIQHLADWYLSQVKEQQ